MDEETKAIIMVVLGTPIGLAFMILMLHAIWYFTFDESKYRRSCEKELTVHKCIERWDNFRRGERIL